MCKSMANTVFFPDLPTLGKSECLCHVSQSACTRFWYCHPHWWFSFIASTALLFGSRLLYLEVCQRFRMLYAAMDLLPTARGALSAPLHSSPSLLFGWESQWVILSCGLQAPVFFWHRTQTKAPKDGMWITPAWWWFILQVTFYLSTF